MAIRAVIMAGGKGTRLRPLTCNIPKPMVPIAGKPVMEYTMELLKLHGISQVAVTMAYLPDRISNWFGSGSEQDMKIHYCLEDSPLGTGGSVKNAGDFLSDTFIVISGDALTDLDIGAAVDFHRRRQSQATLVLKAEPVPLEYGVVIVDDEGRVERFLEKPSWGEVFSDTINTGIYILEPQVMEYYTKGEAFDFSQDLFPRLLADKVPMYGYVADSYWCDIGDLRSYRQAQFDVLDGKVKVKIPGKEVEPGIWLGKNVHLDTGVELKGPLLIGDNCRIESDAKILPYSIIGSNCLIGDNVSMKQTVLWSGVRLGQGTETRGATICSGTALGSGASALENSVIGSDSLIGDRVQVDPDTKIWPGKKVAAETRVSSDLIWGTRASKTLFGRKDIHGELNRDITPDMACRLGMAFGSTLEKGGLAVLGSAPHPGAIAFSQALASGLLATGLGVLTLNSVAAPMTRFGVRKYEALGGVHVRREGKQLHLEFIDAGGINLNRSGERKLENTLASCDFRLVAAEEFRDIRRRDDLSASYFRDGEKYIVSLDENHSLRLVVAAREQYLAFTAAAFLTHIGCEVIIHYQTDDEKQLSRRVREAKADLGVLIGCDGESLTLFDSSGKTLSRDTYSALTALISVARSANLVLPHTAPDALAEVAHSNKAEVRRTKSAPSELMAALMAKPEFGLQAILCFDGIRAPGIVADYMRQTGASLKEIIDGLPPLNYLQTQVPCSWQDKGRIIRELAHSQQAKEVELLEGIKIRDKRGWALVLPDSEAPLFNIYSEGHSEEFARELSDILGAEVQKLLKH